MRSRSLSGRIPATYWEHEEYDVLGRLIARYESFTESGARVGGARSGWRYAGDLGPLILLLDEALEFVATEGFFWINA